MTGAQHVHSLMHIRRDLRRGMVAVGVRFHDVRTADNLLLTGNVVRFAHRGRRYSVDVEDAIRDVDESRAGRRADPAPFERAVLQAALGRRGGSAGSAMYTQFDARSMLFGVEAALEVDPAPTSPMSR